MIVNTTILDQETGQYRADLEIEVNDNTLFIHQSNPDACDELLAAVCIQDGMIKVIAYPGHDQNVTTSIKEADAV